MHQYKGKKIAIYGLGVSGKSALQALSRTQAIVHVVNAGDLSIWEDDARKINPLVKCTSEIDAEEILGEMDLIILAPGIPKQKDSLRQAIQKNIPIMNEIEFAYRQMNTHGKFIGITGTNGKTTTVTMLKELMEMAKLSVFCGGNIGTPLCDSLDNIYDYYLLELSSFQLESLQTIKFEYSAILNIYPNHGERYETVQDYAKAKLNLFKYLEKSKVIICGRTVEKFIEEDQKKEFQHLDPSVLKQFDLKNFKLPGEHNRENLNFCIQLALLLNISPTLIQKFIDSFLGVEHRIEFVPNKLGKKIFNDAKSTNWDATMSALKSMPSKSTLLIIGGQKRGHNDEITPYLDELKKLTSRLILIGETASMHKEQIDALIENHNILEFDEIYDLVVNSTEENILFSPAFPSFDMFKNYSQRGKIFKKMFND